MRESPLAPSFEQALQAARAVLREASTEPEQRQKTGPLLAAFDRLLEQEASAPSDSGQVALLGEADALRRDVERLNQVAERNQSLLSTVLFQCAHGILVCDQKGKIIIQNKAAERIWAGSATTETTDDWGKYRAFHPDGRPFGPNDWSMSRCLSENRTVEAEEVHFQRFDGSHGMLLGSCAPIRDEAGHLLGAVGVFADITGFKQVERLKDRWVALAGHEIRSPLQVITSRVSMASSALATRKPVDTPALLDILMRQVERLQTLVNDMLDASRAQAGTLHVAPVPTQLAPLVSRAAEAVVHSSPKHQLALDAEDVVVLADQARTEQLVTNLVSNAVRYSPVGGRIRIRVRPHEEGGLVEVQDEGIGFEPEHAQRLFEPFLQLTLETRRDGGLGLGLYLSRELVERMKGRIWASSPGPGKGATFAFLLPRAHQG